MPKKPAINKEDRDYQFSMGEKYFEQFLERGRVLNTAIKWYELAAVQRHPLACLRLGHILGNLRYKRFDAMRSVMMLTAGHILQKNEDIEAWQALVADVKKALSQEQFEEALLWARDFVYSKHYSLRYVFEYLYEHISEVSSLHLSCLADLKKTLAEALEHKQQHRRPCSPPANPVRVIHDRHTVPIPRPVVLIDSREPEGHAYSFARFDNWFADTKRKKLKTGDYSLAEWPDEIAIERKTLADLVGSVMPPNRERFLTSCERLAKFRRRAIVIEASLLQAKCFYGESGAHPNAVVGTMFAIQERWNIPVIWAENRQLAEEAVAHILTKFHALRWLEANNLPVHYVDGDI